jgi:hypothetical protein
VNAIDFSKDKKIKKRIMKCLALKLFQANGAVRQYYPLIVIFVFGALSSVFINKYWNYNGGRSDQQHKHLILHRPFSIVDFDDHGRYDSDQDAHELIIRETEVDVICEFISFLNQS